MKFQKAKPLIKKLVEVCEKKNLYGTEEELFRKLKRKHPIKNWEVSIIEIEDDSGKKYKVTRQMAEMSVSETKIFRSIEDAKKQFDEWLK